MRTANVATKETDVTAFLPGDKVRLIEQFPRVGVITRIKSDGTILVRVFDSIIIELTAYDIEHC